MKHTYLDSLQGLSIDGLDKLHRGIDRLCFTDFPDYANVGDSAIALGQWKYWDMHGIRVDSVYSSHVLDERLVRGDVPILINGGGNMGGLYRAMSDHRYFLAEHLAADVPLIQAPQSVHFPNESDRSEFFRRFTSRENLRVGVRDQPSREALAGHVAQLHLMPDSAHMLGPISAPPPTVKYLVLARRDRESDVEPVQGSIDWPRDPWRRQLTTFLGWRSKRIPALRRLLWRRPDVWKTRAQLRLERGIALLAPAEVIVTDRLHAMILAIQMGRRVVAVDNNNRKLSSYAALWLADQRVPVEFATSVAEALRLVR